MDRVGRIILKDAILNEFRIKAAIVGVELISSVINP